MLSFAVFFLMIIGVLSLAGTLISLTILYRCSSVSKTALGVCLTNLAINQFGFAIFGHLTFVVPSQVAQHWVWGSASCDLFGFLKSYFQSVILSCVLVLSVERYVKRRESLNRFHTPLFFFQISIGLWVYCAFWAILPFVGWGSYERKEYSCDILMVPRGGEWKDFSYALVFSFATFIVPSALMFHLLGRSRKSQIVWKVNQKRSWLDSPRIFVTTTCLSASIFFLFCLISLIGFADWLPNSMTGERIFYFETLHTMLSHLLLLMNPLIYLVGVPKIRQELERHHLERAIISSSSRQSTRLNRTPLIEKESPRNKAAASSPRVGILRASPSLPPRVTTTTFTYPGSTSRR